MRFAVLGLTLAGACHPPGARLIWEGGVGPPSSRLTVALRESLPPAAPGVRAAPWGEAADATFRLLVVEAAEEPHVHDTHDLTVVLLEGRGRLVVEGRRYAMRAGDVAHVGRGKVHHFHPAAGPPVVGLAIYTPPLTSPDRRSVAGSAR